MAPPGSIYSIGHSNHPIERFLDLLHPHRVRRLVDVRSHPTSRHAPQFRKQALADALRAAGVEYRWLGQALGGRPEDPDAVDATGRLLVARRVESPDFQAGLERLLGWAEESTTAVMCAEEDPQRCHRTRLLGPVLAARDVALVHIRGDGTLESGSDPSHRNQLDLFPDAGSG